MCARKSCLVLGLPCTRTFTTSAVNSSIRQCYYYYCWNSSITQCSRWYSDPRDFLVIYKGNPFLHKIKCNPPIALSGSVSACGIVMYRLSQAGRFPYGRFQRIPEDMVGGIGEVPEVTLRQLLIHFIYIVYMQLYRRIRGTNLFFSGGGVKPMSKKKLDYTYIFRPFFFNKKKVKNCV